jgi:tryprostatin B 6-hydroxylase
MLRKVRSNPRLGPSEVTVFHPDVFMAIDGPSSKCSKAEWYDLLHPNTGLVTTREKELHKDRRRRWNRGFTPKGERQRIL